MRILFVCLGNICRSPTAEGTMRALVREAGMEELIELDSAGTGGWHVGSAPDERATAAAAGRGIALEGSARRVRASDFDDFDLMIAMDSANLGDLRALAEDDEQRAKVRLLREFDAASDGSGDLDVPDPYYGSGDLDVPDPYYGSGDLDVPDPYYGSGDLDVPDPYYGSGDGFERVLDMVEASCRGLLAQIRAGELR